jgi:FMN phosphatase YigB (HAD superfamily)
MIQAICFDLNGTLFDLSRPPEGVTEDMVQLAVEDYLAHIKKPEWSPLTLPEWWAKFPLFYEVGIGLASLRSRSFECYTLSNNPTWIQLEMFPAYNALFAWDRRIDLAACHVYKPNQRAYDIVPGYLRLPHNQIAVVTANESFGDLEGARRAGMRPILLERYGPKKDPTQESYRDCVELAEALIAEKLR